MRKIIILLLCILIWVVGCSANTQTSVKTNIKIPDGILFEITDVKTSYSKENNLTSISVGYVIKNNTQQNITKTDYKILFTGYTSDNQIIFETISDSLFTKANELLSGTSIDGYFNTGFINGMEKIDRLDITLR
jgi:uncharacterized protein YcfL